MSGIEIGIAVVGAVAALITAYKDGSKIADRIKKKRAKKGAELPDPNLEKALKDGEIGITRMRDEGKDVRVDTEAAMALKDLIIEVQANLLHELAEAEQDDNYNDFSSTIQAAVRTRRKAINVLNDLYTRTEEKEAEDRLKAKADRERQEKEYAEARPTSSPEPHRRPTLDDGKSSSRMKFWRKNSAEKKAQSKEMLSPNLTPSELSRQSTVVSPSRQSTIVSPSRQSTAISPSLGPTSPILARKTTSVYSRQSTFSILSPPLTPEQLQPLTESNKFGGFCKGAWRAQNLNLAKAVGKPSLRSWGWSFHCAKCDYSLQADVRDRNNPRFDDRVYKNDEMKFRLLFLLKSHLPQKGKEPRKYGCILCSLAGGQKKCAGESHLFEHIGQHAMQTYGGTLLAGPVSIGSDGVMLESMSTYDVIFDGGEDFVLPESAMDMTSHELDAEPLSLVDDVFGDEFR